MLLQFTAENFRSIRDEVELSMRASDEVPGDTARAQGVVSKVRDDLEVLRCAAIYGANASGKSNLVRAMLVARQMVRYGMNAEGARLGMQAFRLDAARREQPSRFEFYMLVDGEIYGYGFAATTKAIVEESLTMMIDGKEVEIFSRQDGHIQLSEVLRSDQDDAKFLEYVARGTPTHQLFLHEAVLRNVRSRAIHDVFHWFGYELKIIQPSSAFTQLLDLADFDSEFREFLVHTMSWADTGIKQLRVVHRRRRDEPANPFADLLALIRAQPTYSINSGYRDENLIPPRDADVELRLELLHSDDASHPTFELEDESDGTRRLLDLAPLLYLASKNPTVLVIDELDRSLHTLLAQQLIETFIDHLPASTQLVFTTHDTNLLDCRALRPDCIWFTEKDSAGATSLYSLAEFKPEHLAVLSKDLEKGYLRGRFGGIPFLGDPRKLGWVPRKDGEG